MVQKTCVIPRDMKVINERFHYSPGVLVGGGGKTLYIAGQVGRDNQLNVIADPEAQIVAAFDNLGRVLREAGADFGNIIDLVTYHTDMRDLGLFIQVKDRYFDKDFPTWTAIGTSALAMPGLIVEIKATAAL